MVSIDDLAQKIWHCSPEELNSFQEEAFNLRVKNFGSNLWCYSPSMIYYGIDQYQDQDRNKFSSISVTGTSCALKCDHCEGKLLETMHPSKTPKRLLDLARKFKEKGVKIC